LKDVLSAYYTVNEYGDSTNALMGLNLSKPGLVLVGEYVPPSRGFNFIRAMRNDRAIGLPPVIFLADKSDPDNLKAALDAGADDCLMKPYRRSDLRRAITSRLDQQVSRRWLSLPPKERQALESTLGVFNGITDVVEVGGAIQYLAVEESCVSLVEVANPSSLSILFDAVDEHHNQTFVHSFRMAALMAAFGRHIDLPKPLQLLLASGGMLHDIGKLTISHGILYKRDPLTKEEQEVIRGHVAASLRILRTAEDLPPGIAVIVGRHHERLDGSGYPAGLMAEQMNDLARISAIADVFADLTAAQPCRPTMTIGAALKVMTEDMRDRLDQKLVSKFSEMITQCLGRGSGDYSGKNQFET